ncbi:MAG: hypothetical protein DHS20C18_35320 [Saprospiraceae bacterium]|nr:MAG: hypothetical protein DHS20C18_35320 [Saprospiraceae bacterium]
MAQCNGSVVLNLSGPTVGDWTAPATGGPFLVNITAKGGSGGAYLQYGPDRTGGSGATMIGSFVVQNGETLRAIAGEGGYHSDLEGGGGAGGSGAVNCGVSGDCSTGTILIIAAGGNGGNQLGPNVMPYIGYGLGGSADTGGSGIGGIHLDSDSGGGGGGVNSSGTSASSGGGGGERVSTSGLVNGGYGSNNVAMNSGNNKGGMGMGGGGGGGDGATVDNAAGGGGGHTGGSGGNFSAATSFNSGFDQSNINGIYGGGSTGVIESPSDPGTVTVICLNALPVSLINFKALIQNDGVSLHWSTATEINNLGFEIEQSVDGRNWSEVGFVGGHGTTNIQRNYVFKHENPHYGINYYRLKQLDFDGVFDYSPIVVANQKTAEHKFDIFPNPSRDGALSLRIVSKTEGHALLEIFDWAGYRVYRDPISLYEGTMVWPVSMATFPKGAYTARIELPSGEVAFRKIILQ